MRKLKNTPTLAGALAVLIVALQWAVAQAEPITALLLSLGIDPGTLETVKTLFVLVLTLLGAGAAYQVKARKVWQR